MIGNTAPLWSPLATAASRRTKSSRVGDARDPDGLAQLQHPPGVQLVDPERQLVGRGPKRRRAARVAVVPPRRGEHPAGRDEPDVADVPAEQPAHRRERALERLVEIDRFVRRRRHRLVDLESDRVVDAIGSGVEAGVRVGHEGPMVRKPRMVLQI